MAEIKITGIMRAGAYSPNHIGNDAAIFNVVTEHLRKRGCEVLIFNEEQFIAGKAAGNEAVVVNMCREWASIERLQRLEDEGSIVLNSGYGIENCIRRRMARILPGSGVPYPESFLVNTDEAIRQRLDASGFGPCWIKRADSHTRHKEDISYARHSEEAQELLQEYFMRGIKQAVVSRHVTGALVKFYGIVGSPFFYWFYPFGGAEGRRGLPHSMPENFDSTRLRSEVEHAADVLDVKIYGGDCIVDAEGNFTIVDFKDWPSFAPCRAQAAPHIARFIINTVKNRK